SNCYQLAETNLHTVAIIFKLKRSHSLSLEIASTNAANFNRSLRCGLLKTLHLYKQRIRRGYSILTANHRVIRNWVTNIQFRSGSIILEQSSI
ncbi:hypothetical protein GIB67_028067, partial [Kingdonia uniflora]